MRKTLSWNILIALSVSLFFSHALMAQFAPGSFADASHPAGAPDPQKLADIWQVDPITNQVSIRVPFATTPQGGRGPKIPFALLYNSGSTVTLQTTGSVPLGTGIASNFYWSAHPLAWVGSLTGPTGPWTTTGPYFYSEYSNVPDQGFTDTNGQWHVTGYGCIINGPYTYVDENGAAHGMDLEGFTTNDPNGPFAAPCGPAQVAAQTYWPMYTTYDGSAMATGNTYTVGPDGTTASGKTLTDPNQNAASLNTVSGVTTAADALGRTVYKTNIPIGQPGQIPAGSYYFTTYGESGGAETYTVKFSSVAIGSFTMPHPTNTEFSSALYCIGNGCAGTYVVHQPSQGDTLTAITEIDLPDGTTSYKFSYDPTYGTISKITFPTGGYVQFEWGIRDKDWSPYGQFQTISSIVVTGVDVSDGSSLNHWTYAMESLSNSSVPIGKVTAPDSTLTTYGAACFDYTQVPLYQFHAKSSCKEASRSISDSSGNLKKTVAQNFTGEGLPTLVATTLYDGPSNLQQLVEYKYDKYDNVTEKDESDYYTCSGKPCPTPSNGSTPSGGWKRITYTTYAWNSNSSMATAHIVNKPSQILVTDGSGSPASLTNYTYSTDGRGNLLNESKCITMSGTYPSVSCASSWQTEYTPDAHGQVTQKIEGYGTSAAATTTYAWSGQGGGYLYSVLYANGCTDSYTYFEATTGQVETHTDCNAEKTSYDYSDPFNRIRSVTLPSTWDGSVGANASGATSYTYVDSAGGFSVQEQHTITGTTKTTTTKTFDGLGRVVTATTQVPTIECGSGVSTVTTSYDELGRVYSVSNPYCSTSDSTYGLTRHLYDALGRETIETLPDSSVRTTTYGGNATEVTDPSNGTTNVTHIQQVDGLGHLTDVCEVTSSPLGNDSNPQACGLNISGNGYHTVYAYDVLGDLLSVNQHGQSRRFNYDGLSRLLCASNPENTTASCPATPSSSWVTGTQGYSYSTPSASCSSDPTLPCSRTDARGVITKYAYDSMNRLTGKSYSTASSNTTGPISDLSACFQYDVPLSGVSDPNPKGQLTADWQQPGLCPTSPVSAFPPNAVAGRVHAVHDALGRVGLDQQCLTGSGCSSTTGAGNFNYSYNLLGGLVQSNNGIGAGTVSSSEVANYNSTPFTSPSVTWMTTYDVAGQIQKSYIQDQPGTSIWPVATAGKAFSNAPTLLQATAYDPFGHLTGAQVGIPYNSSSAAVDIGRQYDNRGRITNESDQGQGTTATATGSTGSITLSGTEAGPLTATATSGSALLTVSGSDGSHLVCQTTCNQYTCWQTCNNVPDTGTLSVTINGFASSVSYSSSSSDASIAGALTAGFNSSGSPVTAAYSTGSTSFTVTAKTTGSSSNYPITYSNGDYYIANPYSTLTGGHNAGTVYDAGTVTATIITSGSPSSYTTSPVNWGQGDTPSTVASHLASAIATAAGSVVTATANGGTINLASTATGSSTNYTVSVIVNDTQSANYPTLFPSPSFSAVSTNMTGGGNASTSYGTIYTYQVPSGGYAPNGNILQHVDSVMGTWNFSYDAMDRLMTATQTASTSTSTQYANKYGCWQYDSYGNRTQEAFSATGCASNPPLQSWANYSTASNRMTSSSYATAGVTYDATGNTLYDGRNRYWYDAEGQLCAVQTVGGGYYGYVYDAEGARVAKGTLSSLPGSYTATCAPPAVSGSTLTSSEGLALTSRYLVDQGGAQVTELNSAGTWQHSNVWMGGRLTATYDTKGLHFDLADPLGTKRVQANEAGQVDEYCTGLPFGNDINNPMTVPCSAPVNALQTNEDATEHHFISRERDTETGNDDLLARYYANAYGRFITPDWSVKEDPVPYAILADPQSLDLYGYAQNNPLTKMDPDGHECRQGDWGCNTWDLVNQLWNKIHDIITPGQTTTPQADSKEKLAGAQDNAMHNPNFNPRAGNTFCNQATCSIASTMGAPMSPLTDGHGHALSANDQAKNLAHSDKYRKVTPDEAQALANKGTLVIAAYYNPNGHGHVTTVRPEGIPGDAPTKGRGPLLNDIGRFHAVQYQNHAFRASAEVNYYTPK